MESLSEIQKKLKVPKKHKNDFGGYYYRTCEDILSVVKQYLTDSHILLSDEVINISGKDWIKSTAKLVSGEASVESIGWARIAEEKKGMDPAQITGAASSYARKYALCGLFAIDGDSDPDCTNDHGSNGHQKISAPKHYINSSDNSTDLRDNKIKLLEYVKTHRNGIYDGDISNKDFIRAALKNALNITEIKNIEQLNLLRNMLENGDIDWAEGAVIDGGI